MTGSYTYRTGIMFTLSDAREAKEHDVFLTLRYSVHPGCEPTREQPGEGPSVSIHSATVRSLSQTMSRWEYDAPEWLWPHIEDDAALEAELLTHAAQQDEAARDSAADMHREERAL